MAAEATIHHGEETSKELWSGGSRRSKSVTESNDVVFLISDTFTFASFLLLMRLRFTQSESWPKPAECSHQFRFHPSLTFLKIRCYLNIFHWSM